jgi:hypothetical protein
MRDAERLYCRKELAGVPVRDPGRKRRDVREEQPNRYRNANARAIQARVVCAL